MSGRTARRRRTLAAGMAVAIVYLAGAAMSGHLSILARRPLLDGLTTSVVYRWVSPPPPLAANNQEPHSASQDFAFAGGELKGGVVSPNDLQITVIVQDGAIAASPGQTAVRITITPLDPGKLGPPPASLSFDGNAYRVDARYVPNGEPVGTLKVPFDMAMVYPADATFGLGSVKHVILASPTGRNWDILPTTDLPASQQASTKAQAPGYFVVGRPGGAGTVTAPSRSYLPIVIAGVFVLLILLITSPRVIRRLRGRSRGRGEHGPDAS